MELSNAGLGVALFLASIWAGLATLFLVLTRLELKEYRSSLRFYRSHTRDLTSTIDEWIKRNARRDDRINKAVEILTAKDDEEKS